MDQIDPRSADAHPSGTWPEEARAIDDGRRRARRGRWVEADLHWLLCGRPPAVAGGLVMEQ
jgi:hypothetical protein